MLNVAQHVARQCRTIWIGCMLPLANVRKRISLPNIISSLYNDVTLTSRTQI